MARNREQDGFLSGYDNRNIGSAVGMGLLTGSLITVIMLVLSIAVGAAISGLSDWMRYYLSYIVAGLAGGILQQLWFNYHPAMRFAYSARLLGFGITYYVVLAACAYFGSWLPAGNPWAWATFSIIFLVIFAAVTFIIGVSLKKRGIEYTERLDEYHAKRRGE